MASSWSILGLILAILGLILAILGLILAILDLILVILGIILAILSQPNWVLREAKAPKWRQIGSPMAPTMFGEEDPNEITEINPNNAARWRNRRQLLDYLLSHQGQDADLQ